MYARYVLALAYAGVLHFLWEYSHLYAYTAYDALGNGILLNIWATGGDVMYTAIGLMLGARVYKKWDLIAEASLQQYVFLSIYGMIAAIAIEWKALYFQRWAYTSDMPIIPWAEVGLYPVIQMAAIIPLAVFFAKYTIRAIISLPTNHSSSSS